VAADERRKEIQEVIGVYPRSSAAGIDLFAASDW
jgi:hypothetical protein